MYMYKNVYAVYHFSSLYPKNYMFTEHSTPVLQIASSE
jgi:hypothetical protein